MTPRRWFAARRILWALVLWSFWLGGCFGTAGLETPGANLTPGAPGVITPGVQPTLGIETQTVPARPNLVLRVWLPRQFDIHQDNPASLLLRKRLDEFLVKNPGVSLDVRIKAESGPGGMLESLAAASAAAPLAMPDLVALSRSTLEPAALKGYLRSYAGLTSLMEETDWYEYAHQMSLLQQSLFGLPFAGDALVMAFNPEVIAIPPQDWAQTLSISATLVFPASDPAAMFTQVQYLAAGGQVQDDQGRPALDEMALLKVLQFYQQASTAGQMPFWLTQYETDDQAWEAWQAGQSDLNITWVSRVLQSPDRVLRGASMPTISGQAYTVSSGWVWALSSPSRDPQREALAIRLAEFLCEPNFLGAWTQAAGYLPTRSKALDAWDAGPYADMARTVVASAHQMPSANILAVVGPALRQAVTSVLRQQASPEEAARSAVELFKNP